MPSEAIIVGDLAPVHKHGDIIRGLRPGVRNEETRPFKGRTYGGRVPFGLPIELAHGLESSETTLYAQCLLRCGACVKQRPHGDHSGNDFDEKRARCHVSSL